MEQRDQKKKMSVTPNSSPPSNGEVRDHHQNSLSSSSAQTLNYDRHPPPHPFTEPNNLQNQHPPPSNPQPPGSSPYRECLKNHAAAIGGHVVDGCGEFMPAGEDGTPESFKCAACDCHRNFHRRVLLEHPNSSAVYYGAGGGFIHPPVSYYSNAGKNNHIVTTTTHSQPIPPPPLSLIPDHRQSRPGPAIPVMMAFGGCNNPNGGGGGGGADSASSEEDLSNSGGRGAIGLGFDKINYYNCTEAVGSSGKKRFRTKFTVQQKDKMAEFAEKLGWKISKQDEQDLARFCAEMGIKRQVFKVWMHNSKQALKKKNHHH